ncbi:hypothetical protein [Candidatus Uabimicrobium amorphum]|uniref:Uncharacterized protein n=1 Tax=Uabimicrobium amorphum TaxID=2596890 RepID=A0A5S9IM74_UABAM|nr:hypothetical protein [Candidatus Uabimicrobium amorphum]BBM84087.1 hypothetical protein UABAM_02443 [Candidatus Uabimicrobium amorphum]
MRHLVFYLLQASAGISAVWLLWAMLKDSPYRIGFMSVEVKEYQPQKFVQIEANGYKCAYIAWMIMLGCLGLLYFVMIPDAQKYLRRTIYQDEWLEPLIVGTVLGLMVVYAIIFCLDVVINKSGIKTITFDVPQQTVTLVAKGKSMVIPMGEIKECKMKHWVGLKGEILVVFILGEFGGCTVDIIPDYSKLQERLDMWRDIFGERFVDELDDFPPASDNLVC